MADHRRPPLAVSQTGALLRTRSAVRRVPRGRIAKPQAADPAALPAYRGGRFGRRQGALLPEREMPGRGLTVLPSPLQPLPDRLPRRRRLTFAAGVVERDVVGGDDDEVFHPGQPAAFDADGA